jgi:hypothetical protein
MKILYVIMHTQNQNERYDNVMNTWGRDVDCIFYSDHEDLNKNIIISSNDTSYKSNEEKFCNILNLIPDRYQDYDWFLFCDNDTFVNTKLLSEKITDFDENIVYGQELNTYHSDKSLYYVSGGAGKLVSNKILQLIKGNVPNRNTTYADVTLGYALRDLNISIQDYPLFKSQPPEFYKINDNDVQNFITFHYIKTTELMNKLYNLTNEIL